MYAMSASNDPGPGGNYRQALLAVFRSTAAAIRAPGRRASTTRSRTAEHAAAHQRRAATVRECSNNAERAPNNYINMGWYVNVLAVDPRDPKRVWAARRRLVPLGRWRTQLGSGDERRLAQTAVLVARRSTRHRVSSATTATPIRSRSSATTAACSRRRTRAGRRRPDRAPRARRARSGVAGRALNRGYGVTQFYHGLPYADGTRYLGGTQDNGTMIGVDTAGADGVAADLRRRRRYVAVTPTTRSAIYARVAVGELAQVRRRSTVARVSPRVASMRCARTSSVRTRTTCSSRRSCMDPSASQRLWLGGEHLYRTINGAALDQGEHCDAGRRPRQRDCDCATDANRVIAGTPTRTSGASRSAPRRPPPHRVEDQPGRARAG